MMDKFQLRRFGPKLNRLSCSSCPVFSMSILQDFARALRVMEDHWFMTKRALVVVLGCFSFSLSLVAQPADPSAVFSALNNNAALHLPYLSLADGGSFSFVSAFDRMEAAPADIVLPTLVVRQPRRVAAVSAVSLPDSSKEVAEVRRPLFDYAGGEVGILYGRSSGKFGREVESGYIFGEVGNEHMQLSAGASYEHTSGRVPRFGR